MEALVGEEAYFRPTLPLGEDFAKLETALLRYLVIDGSGDPKTCPDFWAAMEGLYQMAYAVKFISNEHWRDDCGLPPLEGLWWNSYLDQGRSKIDRDCHWKLLLRQPEWVAETTVCEARRWLEAKRSWPSCKRVSLEQFEEGEVFQTEFCGTYKARLQIVARLHGFIAEQGYEAYGKYHEIYLDSFSISGQEKVRVILRQPVRPLSAGPAIDCRGAQAF
jgi:hypothetical protein